MGLDSQSFLKQINRFEANIIKVELTNCKNNQLTIPFRHLFTIPNNHIEQGSQKRCPRATSAREQQRKKIPKNISE